MINRQLIRLKTIQITYAYEQNKGQSVESTEKELMDSLSRAYDLYHHLLLLMVEIHRLGERALETGRTRAQQLGEECTLSSRFVDNRFALLLESNKQLCDYRDNRRRFDWADDEEFVRGLYVKIVRSTFYKDYMESTDCSFDADRELWRQIYRHILCENEELDNLLEDQDIYWNDDRFIVDTFVLKTIRQFPADATDDFALLPDYKNEEDREFAKELLRQSLTGASHYRSLIQNSIRGWEMERIALMDIVILQTALAEIISFPAIPLGVSINEYVDIAKMYSTPKSSKFINATLDNIAKNLIEEHRIVKKA